MTSVANMTRNQALVAMAKLALLLRDPVYLAELIALINEQSADEADLEENLVDLFSFCPFEQESIRSAFWRRRFKSGHPGGTQ